VTEIRLNLYYPHPPERVWRAITDSRAIAAWLMENDFAPRVGHRFRMRPVGLPGFDGLIDGEVTDIVPLSQVRMTWRSGETVADVTWMVKMAPGGSSMQMVHNGELDSGAANEDRTEALEQTYAVIFEQHLPLVLHDFAIESGAAVPLASAEGLPVTPAEGKDRPVEFPAVVEMDWVSAGLSSPVAGGVAAGGIAAGGVSGGGAYGGAVSGGGAYGGTVYGGAEGGPVVLAPPQIGSDHVWGNDISPPSGVSLGDGLSLGGYWSSDGVALGVHGAPESPAAIAAAERRRTRNLILLSVGSLVAVLVFVLGAWAAFSDPGSPKTTTPPTRAGGSPGLGANDPGTRSTPSPGATSAANDNPNGNVPGGGGDPADPNGQGGGNGSGSGSGSGGGSDPDPQQSSGSGGGTTPTEAPAQKPLAAVVHPLQAATSAQAPYDAWVFTVTIRNPGTEDVGGWRLDLELVTAGLRGKVDDGSINVSRQGVYVRLSSSAAIPAGGEVKFHLIVEGTDASVVLNCRINKADARCDIR
jgi:uncharacterized protein YndB with AHSA1/START domain